MKRLVVIAACLVASTHVSAQKTELRISLNSGLFFLRGESVRSTTTAFASPAGVYSGYLGGSRPGLSMGAAMSLTRVSKRNFLWGAELDWERVRSRIGINKLALIREGIVEKQIDASGKSFLRHDNLLVHPFIGYRFFLHSTQLNLTGGLDIAFRLKTNEHGNVKAVNGVTYEIDGERESSSVDLRPRMQLAVQPGRLSVYVGYSHGLVNLPYSFGGEEKARSGYFRFGASYLLN